MVVSQLMFRYWFGHQLSKRKELLYNLGAISSYSSMLIFCGMALKCLFHNNRLNIPLCCMPDLLSFPFWWWLHTNGIRNGCVSRRLSESLFSEYLWSFIWFVHRFIRLRCWYRGFVLRADSILFICSQPCTERALKYWVFPCCNLTI